MNKYLVSRNVVALLLATSIITLTTLAGCGCLSDSDSSGESESDRTSASITTKAYAQSGGTSAQATQVITASNPDESSIKVTDGGTFTLSDSTIRKTGNTSSIENSDFYGLNAAVLADSCSKVKLTNCTVSTSANGSNAVFATGTGSSIILSDVEIKTTGDGSRGVDATFTGNITCTDVDISTEGQHCAAIATDRGSGTVTVKGGTMNTVGEGSPGIYSTGVIKVSKAVITSIRSEAAVIEGRNSITITNVTLSGAKKCGVMLYQNFSGDAEVGTSIFKMNGGSLMAGVGPLFYITNTDSVIELKGADLTATSGTLLTASADKWGNTGSNGGVVTLKAEEEVLNGDITCDNLSSVTVILENGTSLTGAINANNTAGSIVLTLDSTSSWDVTGTSYLTSLIDKGPTLANIKDNGYTIYYDADESTNSWLKGRTYTLTGGGKITPFTCSV
ncbi:hypothetical protein MSSIT_1298 [Methanosarcina siciliae T4/M]|uniref:Uncharacterized protein n=1 Tax=Methanosarcina siciliae T4/M TaxID=1434120 RepID=A0A0E3P3G0_9EURY|nr:hypothetical protein [Methanosarcina siciliae]AKB28017.1 hypothetical protein MSSIT_1298 [Methanosarcina siciliae T4/M]